ncbi:MAG: SpaH/EbpB family LPXTG-anchored major pilin [Eubacteriaceae bacterium]|jgi:fimbrial isopeptide formation D2 family protein/LPXTG-motif cell wall-anchored protein
MKKYFTRIGTMLVALALIVAMIPSAAFAADPGVGGGSCGNGANSIVLTKLKGTEAELTYGGDGSQQDITGKQTMGGIEFSIYDTGITQEAYAGIGDGTNQVPEVVPTEANESWAKVATAKTDSSGQITWTGLGNKVYYVCESAANSTVQDKSVPFFVVLPYTTTEGTTTNTVYVYPKNVPTTPAISIDKVTANNSANDTYEVAAAGETIHYTATVTLPETTDQVTVLDLVDKQNDGLSLPSNIVVKMGDTEIPYSYGYYNNDFSLMFLDAGIAKIKEAYAAGNKTLVVTYDVTLTDEATAGVDYQNTMTVVFNYTNSAGEITAFDTADVTTGNLTINKTGKAGAALEGVTFTITGPNNYSQTAVTDANGKIVLDGLGDGEYTVKETKTVEGYVINPTEQKATIAGTTKSLDGSDTHAVVTMQNYEKPLLPLTGGTGIALIAVAGVALIGGGFFLMKKRAHNA